MTIKKVGVVGSGTMGSGIVQVIAQAGYEVIVSDANNELLNKGLISIEKSLARGVERGRVTQQDKDSTMGRIKGTVDMKDFGACDMVIEAVPEIPDLKKKIFTELDRVCPKETVLATNTSVLFIIEIAMTTSRPDKVLGLHFFNPPSVMKLLEIVQTIATSNETLQTSQEFGKSLGKTIIVAKDLPGFIVNRLMVPYILNAIRMFEGGQASKEDIDNGIVNGLNNPLGPLALADLIGIDTVYFMAKGIYDKTGETQYFPPVMLQQMFAGWLGRKSGKGFYEYKK